MPFPHLPQIPIPDFDFFPPPEPQDEKKPEIPPGFLRGGAEPGMKYDAGKLGYDLIDEAAEAEFVAVLTYGAVKYEADNWAKVDNADRRYYAAARRHMEADRRGEHIDEEHGLLALAGAICDLHFLLALRLRRNPELRKNLPERLKKALEIARKFREAREAQKTAASRELAAMLRGEKPAQETPVSWREKVEERLKEYEALDLIPPKPGTFALRKKPAEDLLPYDGSGLAPGVRSAGSGLGYIERRERAAERRKKPRKTSRRKKN